MLGRQKVNFFALDLKKLIIALVLVATTLFAINMQRKADESPWFLKPFAFLAGSIQNAYSNIFAVMYYYTPV